MGNFIKQFFDIKFWKFILVGILNTVVGMGLQFLFFNLCGWNEWVSSLIGYILGSILSYFLNKYFTFKNKDKGWKPIVKFALNIAICYGLAYGIAIPLISMLCTANSWTMFGWSVENSNNRKQNSSPYAQMIWNIRSMPDSDYRSHWVSLY